MVLEVRAPLEREGAVGTLECPDAGVYLGQTNTEGTCFIALRFLDTKSFIGFHFTWTVSKYLSASKMEAVPSDGLKGEKTS